MDFDSIQQAGSRLGTGTMIILDDQTCPVGMVLNLVRFFAQESCAGAPRAAKDSPGSEYAGRN